MNFKNRFYLENAEKFNNQEVQVHGWVYNNRGSGKIRFLQVRDGTGFVQAVVAAESAPAELFAKANDLKQEASVIITGKIYKEERAPMGYEMQVSSLDVIHNPTEAYPIGKKEHGVDFLLTQRHLWLRAPRQQMICRVRDEIRYGFAKFFREQNFTLVDTPILTGSIGESAGELFETEYFDLGKAYLTQTGQLYLEAACMALGKVWNFGPTFRAEKSKTRRHLTEFWMLEAEVAYNDYKDNMDLQEMMVKYVVNHVLENCQHELKFLERDTDRLKRVVQEDFIRQPYDDTVKKLQKMGSKIEWGSDLGGDDETLLTAESPVPIFVTHYPAKVKAFYMEPGRENPHVVECSDLLAPEGYGEIIGGSARVFRHDILMEKILENKLPPEAYEWYLDLRKWGSVPHAGFGIGLERTISWICGLQHLREGIAFPRMLTRIYP